MEFRLPARKVLYALMILGWLFHGMVEKAGAVQMIGGLEVDPQSGIAVSITNLYEDLPPGGFLPVLVQVENKTPVERSWVLTTVHQSGGLQTMISEHTLAVPGGDIRTFEILVPLLPRGMHSYSNLEIVMTGHGIRPGSASDNSVSSGRTPTPYTGLGKSLALKNWAGLRQHLEKVHSHFLAGTPLDPDVMPWDWRALSAFDLLVFEVDEWLQMSPQARSVVQSWIGQGGRLVLLHEPGRPLADLPQAGARGSGWVAHVPLDAGDPIPQLAKVILSNRKEPLARLSSNYTHSWPLLEQVGRLAPPHGLIIALVLVFAAVIGPVNFLFFAPAGQRHRLFWTTPLISLGASVIMAGGIAISEGFGGTGSRVLLVVNLDDERKQVLVQEQVSRTGVLISGNFDVDRSGFGMPLLTRKSPARGTEMSGGAFSIRGNTYAGDWFRSRSTQSQLLTGVRETRERVEIRQEGEGAPLAASSYAMPLEEFWYVDLSGKVWKAPVLRPGETTALVSASLADLDGWWKTRLDMAGPVVLDRATAFLADGWRGKYFAKQPRYEMKTLPSIRWTENFGLLAGTTRE